MSATTVHSFPSLDSWNSPRAWALAIIVLLHLGFFWALSNGLSHTITQIFQPLPPVYIPVTQQPKPPEPREPRVDIKPTQLNVTPVKPELVIDVEESPREPVILAPEPTIPGDFTGPGDVAPPAPVVVEPRIDARRGLSEPSYPPQVIREGGEGTVYLSLYILADGRVGEVRLDRSSGHARLDESALREAQKWRFVPGTTDGKPMAMWKQVPVTFRLNTRM